MKLKKIFKELPVLPTSALVFYIIMVLLWSVGLIPSPTEILSFLESLYIEFGLFGLGIASFLEGIVYLGLYFPGSFIIVLAVFLSDGSFISLLSISVVVAIAVTLTSFVNYFLGRHISFKRNNSEENVSNKKLSKSFILSMLHPNILAFYFFNSGLERRGLWKIIWVPFFMIPYGLFHAFILSLLAGFIKQKTDNPWALFLVIIIWLIIAFVIEHRRKNKFRIN
jgi:membrane protein YqaA with SNARE-associated domain